MSSVTRLNMSGVVSPAAKSGEKATGQQDGEVRGENADQRADEECDGAEAEQRTSGESTVKK